MLHQYKIKIVMADGSRGIHWGLYDSVWDAIDRAMTFFADAKWIVARRSS